MQNKRPVNFYFILVLIIALSSNINPVFSHPHGPTIVTWPKSITIGRKFTVTGNVPVGGCPVNVLIKGSGVDSGKIKKYSTQSNSNGDFSIQAKIPKGFHFMAYEDKASICVEWGYWEISRDLAFGSKWKDIKFSYSGNPYVPKVNNTEPLDIPTPVVRRKNANGRASFACLSAALEVSTSKTSSSEKSMPKIMASKSNIGIQKSIIIQANIFSQTEWHYFRPTTETGKH